MRTPLGVFAAFALAACAAPDHTDAREGLLGRIALDAQGAIVAGTLGAGTRTRDVAASLGDVADGDGDPLAFAGEIEVASGPIAFAVEGLHADVEADTRTGASAESMALDLDVWTASARLEVARFRAPGFARTDAATTLEALVGVRHFDAGLRLDSTLVPAVADHRSWLDPVVGARLCVPLADGLALRSIGDLGGFGLGSDLCWRMSSLVECDVFVAGRRAGLHFGWRAIGATETAGPDGDRYVFDATLHGPVFGMVFSF